MLQSLLLALFPWLRTERGREVLADAVDDMVPVDIDTTIPGGEFSNWGQWAQYAQYHMLRSYNLRWTKDGADRLMPFGRSA